VKKPIPEFVFSHREVAMLAISCLPLLLSTFGCSSFGFFWACLLFAAELGLSWAPLVFSSGFKTLNDNLVGFQNPKWFQQRVFKTLNHNLVGFPDPLVPAAGFRNPKQHFSNFGPPLGASHFFQLPGSGTTPESARTEVRKPYRVRHRFFRVSPFSVLSFAFSGSIPLPLACPCPCLGLSQRQALCCLCHTQTHTILLFLVSHAFSRTHTVP
jgi:hypothetical protein